MQNGNKKNSFYDVYCLLLQQKHLLGTCAGTKLRKMLEIFGDFLFLCAFLGTHQKKKTLFDTDLEVEVCMRDLMNIQ